MTSDEGLDAYGAVTWGQLFIYQGFNRHIGWMHTSTGADDVDEFAETNRQARRHSFFYRYGSKLKPLGERTITLRYREDDGSMASRTFTTYSTSHGPIVREIGDKWIAMALMNKPIPALEQSFLRTKASDYASYMKVAELKANSSNNTIFADTKGEIAFLLPQFMPKRDNRFDYTKPVDGSDPGHRLEGADAAGRAAACRRIRPMVGFSTPTIGHGTRPGPTAPRKSIIRATWICSAKTRAGLHANEMLESRHKLTPKSLEALAFDPYLPEFARLVPRLVDAYDDLPAAIR